MSQVGKMVMMMMVMVMMVMVGLCQASTLPVKMNCIRKEKEMGTVKSNQWGFNLTTTELIESAGYPSEIHHVTTSDGYILELHRIPYSPKITLNTSRPIALLQHGLLSSSADFIMNTPDQAIGYLLSDAGYDVWMPNLRGNTYSMKHKTRNPDDIDFWNFSWDECAMYDVPESIDYILAHTGRHDLYYLGWSMGTTIFWAMMSERPEYNKKVRAMAALAPVAYLDHAKGPIIDIAPFSDAVDTLLSMFGVGLFLPSCRFMDYLANNWCDPDSITAEICYNILFLIAGPDTDEMNKEDLPIILSHTPAGTSVHTVNHYGQIIRSGEFQKYDHGYLNNFLRYGQFTPPLYNLSAVTTPVALFWGQTDWLAAPEDVSVLAYKLPNVALNHRIAKDKFNHLDFVWSIHTYKYVNRHVLDFFAKY